jgi:predicted DNA-binding WGR domain protein
MTDDELQSLQRAAEASGDGAAWLRAAAAFADAGRHDEAAQAAHRAGARGSDVAPVLDSILPDGVVRARRELGERFELGKLSHAAWSADGKKLFAILERHTILAWDLEAGGPPRRLAVLGGAVTALAAGLDGATLAVAFGLIDRAKMKEVPHVASLSLATGELSEPIGRGHAFVREVVAPAPDLLLCAETKRARAYRREGSAWPDKTCWSVNGELVALGPWGTSAALAREGERLVLALRGPLEKEPRASIGLDLAAVDPRIHVRATARTALVLEDVVVLEADGRPLGRAPIPAGLRVHDVWLSPSGRLVGLSFAERNERSTRMDLVDVVSGKSATFDLGARPRGAAWSLSGRRLAVPTDQGTIVLIEHESERPVPARQEREIPSGMPGLSSQSIMDALWGGSGAGAASAGTAPAQPAEGAWIELRSPDRFWRARRMGPLLEFRHGKLGTKGQVGAAPCDSADAAARELERRIREKERAGYSRV